MRSRPSTAPWFLIPALAAVLALTIVQPAAAVPPFCGCWCTAEPSTTHCTDVDLATRTFVVITCGEWLTLHVGECEPWPYGAAAGAEPTLETAATAEAGPATPDAPLPAPLCTASELP